MRSFAPWRRIGRSEVGLGAVLEPPSSFLASWAGLGSSKMDIERVWGAFGRVRAILGWFWSDFGDQNGAHGWLLGAPKSILSASRELLAASQRSCIDFGAIWETKMRPKSIPKEKKTI